MIRSSKNTSNSKKAKSSSLATLVLSGRLTGLLICHHAVTARRLGAVERHGHGHLLARERVFLAVAGFGHDEELRAFRDLEAGIVGDELRGLGNDLGIPVFTYWRGTDASKMLRSAQRVRSYKLMMPRLAGMFSVSQFLLDNLARHGIRHGNAHVVPSGVDIRRFTPAEKRPGSFLAVGRMVAKKPPQVTLRAFASAAATRDAHLTFIGDGPLLEECKALAQTLGVGDKGTFTGALPHDAVRQHLQTTEVTNAQFEEFDPSHKDRSKHRGCWEWRMEADQEVKIF